MPNQKISANLKSAIADELNKNRFDVTESGIIFPTLSVGIEGTYFTRVNGGEWDIQKNLITKEGLIDVLNTYFVQNHPKKAGFYLALFSGNTAPASNWTAANFTAVANEIVSQTEGYTAATRPQFNPLPATDNTYVDNMTAATSVTIATSSQLNVTGIALLSNSQRGGTTGVLVSATKWPTVRTLQNDDVLDMGYRFALTV